MAMNHMCGTVTPPLDDIALQSLYRPLQKITVDNAAMRDSIQSLQNDYAVTNTLYDLGVGSMSLQQQEDYANLQERKNSLIMVLGNSLQEYNFIQNHVIKALKIWQRRQALCGNGGPFPDNLDEIQYYVESLMDCITEIISIAQTFSYFGDDNLILNEIVKHAHGFLNVLVCSSFIVEKQPPQVIKKSSKFAVTVRWLVGDKLDIYRSNPQVKCEILSEAQARRLATQNNANIQIPPAVNGEMKGNEGQIEFDASNRHFSANLTNLIIKHIQRSERRGPEIVMDEKNTLLFYTTTVYKSYAISCWTLSLPLVVVVHGSQEPQSLATITWDNAFSVIEREPFQVPERVHYTKLLEALNMKFFSYTGRSLTPDNYEFLREKLVTGDACQLSEYISYSQFCRDKLPDRGFTFWEWFYATMKLTKEHLKQMWMDGLIVGFINKSKTMHQILPSQENGTFLLRFSDSELGGISIAFRDDKGIASIIAPWTGNDLTTRSLGNRIQDLEVLRIVFPKMLQRDAAFGSFYTQQPVRMDYVPNRLVVQIAPQQQPDQQFSYFAIDDNDWRTLVPGGLALGDELPNPLDSNGCSNTVAPLQ